MPFNTQQFLDVFARYNETVFPAQILFLIAALVAIRLAGNGDIASSKTVAVILSFLWLWMGVIYHWVFFSDSNSLALVFGGFFVLQSVILFYAGCVQRHLLFHQRSGARSLIGTLFIFYALLIYPIIGMSGGHSYPYSPTLGCHVRPRSLRSGFSCDPVVRFHSMFCPSRSPGRCWDFPPRIPWVSGKTLASCSPA
jgi:hypothetical protein